MRLVQHAAIRPHHCAVLPYIGNATGTRGFIDTGSELDGFDNHVYVSIEAVEVMASMIGWVAPVDQAQLREELATEQTKVRALEAEVAELRAYKAAIGVIEANGGNVKRRPGRPRKTEEVSGGR